MKDIEILWTLPLIALLGTGCGDDTDPFFDPSNDTSSEESTGDSGSETTGVSVSDTTPSTSGDASSTGVDPSASDSTSTTDSTSGGSGAGSTGEGEDSTTDADNTTGSGSDDTGPGSSSGGEDAPTVEVFAIQDGSIPTGIEVVVEELVVTGVTGLGFPQSFGGFFAQEPEGGANGGIFVFAGNDGPDVAGLSVGDIVTLRGSIVEFPSDARQPLTELDISGGTLEVVGSEGTTPVTEVDVTDFADASTAEPWESVLVRISSPLTVTEALERGEFTVSAGETALVIDDFLLDIPADASNFPNFGVGATFESLTGVVNVNAGSFKLAPRDPRDTSGYTAAPLPPGLSIDDVQAGELVITEIMYNPLGASDNNREWFEIYNTSDQDVNLEGMEISDLLSSASTVRVNSSFVVPALSHATIARCAAEDWEFADIERILFLPAMPALNNGGDEITISNAAGAIDVSLRYPNADDDDGISLKLRPDQIDADANDDPSNWCFSTQSELFATIDDGESFGSPSDANAPACREFSRD